MKPLGQNQFPRLEPPGVARVAIVGESWGQRELETGLPFQGPSGALLNAALSQVGIVRDQCFVGNVVNLKPAGNDFATLSWESEEVQAGIAQLREDLLKFRPSLILCLGNAALHLLKHGNVAPRKTRQKRKQEDFESETQDSYGVGTNRQVEGSASSKEGESANPECEQSEASKAEPSHSLSISSSGADGEQSEREEGKAQPVAAAGSFLWPSKIGSWRGSLFESGFVEQPCSCGSTCDVCGNGRVAVLTKCLATFHPAAVLRDFSLQPLFRFDIKRAAHEAKTRALELPKRSIECVHPEGQYIAPPVMEVRRRLREMAETGKLASVDIEGLVGNMTSIAFSCCSASAVVVPFAHASGTSVWNEEEEWYVLEAIKLFLEDERVPKVLQNGLYDAFVLAWTYGIVVRNFAYDTMVGMFECFAELPKGLATQASILTKEPFYKPDKGEEGEMKFASDEEFWRYNGLDACVTLECHEAQMKLMDEGQRAHYRFNMELMPALLMMEIRGMKWDSEAASLARQEALQKAFELQAMIDKEAVRAYTNPCDDQIVDLQSLLVAVEEGREELMTRVVAQQLCQKNIKRSVEVVEERWQPMLYSGRWKKHGKIIKGKEEALHLGYCSSQFQETDPFENGTWSSESEWLKPCHKKVTKNQLFIPLTLVECEEFVLESCRSEWTRVKQIWEEFKNEQREPKAEDQPKESSEARSVEAELHSVCGSDEGAEPFEASSPRSAGGESRNCLLGELSSLLGLSINVGSTQSDGDAQRFLYEICGFKEQFKKVKGKKSDKVSSDQNALVKLYGDTRDIRALWVLQLRRLRKLATDLACEVDADGRIRSTFSLVKETGRMAASESPTGTGGNLQALNKDLRYLVKADAGCQFRQRDLEGADSWTVACHCAALGDPTMLDDLKAGLKPAKVLCLLHKHGAVVNLWTRPEIKDRLKLEVPTFEEWLYPGAKSSTHGGCYGAKVPTIIQTVLKYSMADLPLDLAQAKPTTLTTAQGEALLNAFFLRYKGVKKWHEKISRELVQGKGELRTSLGHIRRFYGRKREFKNGRWEHNHDTFKEMLASEPQYVTTANIKLALHRMWHDSENNPGDGTLRVWPSYLVHDSANYQNRIEDAEWCDRKEAEWFSNEIEIAGIKVVIPSERQISKDWSMK